MSNSIVSYVDEITYPWSNLYASLVNPAKKRQECKPEANSIIWLISLEQSNFPQIIQENHIVAHDIRGTFCLSAVFDVLYTYAIWFYMGLCC